MPYWYWAAFGAVLGVIEVAVPAMVCIWLAAAALGVAVISWRYPGLAWEHQALIFAVLAIASVALGRYELQRPARVGEHCHRHRCAGDQRGRQSRGGGYRLV